MKKFIISLFPIVILACHPAGKSTKTSKVSAGTNDGWQVLFDGASKNAWHIYNSKSDGAAWKVQDGILYLDPEAKKSGAGGGDLVTNEEYENFDLKLEWKIDSAGNSGIIFLTQEDPKYNATYLTGPEMQIIDNNGHRDAKINKHRAGDLYDLVASTPENVHPLEQWNEIEIMINKGQLDLFQNGSKVVSTTMWNDSWKQLIAGSKFKSWAGFGMFQKGKIALQDHGNGVAFRNIRIKRL
jgi:hypothetical protein